MCAYTHTCMGFGQCVLNITHPAPRHVHVADANVHVMIVINTTMQCMPLYSFKASQCRINTLWLAIGQDTVCLSSQLYRAVYILHVRFRQPL